MFTCQTHIRKVHKERRLYCALLFPAPRTVPHSRCLKNECSMAWLVYVGGWALTYASRGHRFNSLSRHIPKLRTLCPVGGMQETTDWCFSSMFLSLLSLPPPSSFCLSKIQLKKIFFKWVFNESPSFSLSLSHPFWHTNITCYPHILTSQWYWYLRTCRSFIFSTV